MKQYVGISRDHSGSMRPLVNAAMQDYNENIKAIKSGAEENDVDTIVSVVKCGVNSFGRLNYSSGVETEVVNSSISKLKKLSSYVADGHSTPLFDSVGTLIELMETVPDSKKKDVTFLVMVITDGEENSSRMYTAATIADKIKKLQATDRWTFVFRVPYGDKNALVRLGIPAGNIQEWETTEHGMEVARGETTRAISRFYKGVGSGAITASSSFYTDMSAVTKKEVKAVLTDISKEVRIFPVKQNTDIRPFVESKLRRPMVIGTAFYELTKRETVQPRKLIAIRDKNTGSVYCGQSARDLLNLPDMGDIRLVPGNHGNYDIYVQSTSVNRKLYPGTSVLYWSNAR